MVEAGTRLKSGVEEEVPPQGGAKARNSASCAVEDGPARPARPYLWDGTWGGS